MKLIRRILSLTLAVLLTGSIATQAGMPAYAADRSKAVVKELSIDSLPKDTEYYPGEKLSLDGLTVKLNHSNGNIDIIRPDKFEDNRITVTPAEGTVLTTEGKNTITVSHGKLTDTFDVTVLPVTVSDITVNTPPTVTEYHLGDKLDLSGLTVKIHFSNGDSNIVSASDLSDKEITVTPAEGTALTTEGKNAITLSYGELTETFDVTVLPVTVSDITVNTPPTVTEYHLGDKLDLSGLTVKIHFSNGDSNIVSASDLSDKEITVTPAEGTVLTTEGKNTITVSHGKLTDTFDVTVLPVTVSDITVNTPPTVTEYHLGDKLDLSGLTVKIHFSNGDSSIVSASDLSDKEITVTPAEGTVLTTEGSDKVILAFRPGTEYEKTAEFEIKISDAAPAGRVIDRIFGSDRYETALAISAKGWDYADNVIIASGTGYADALAGATLSKAANAPILLAADGDNTNLLGEIDRLGAVNVYILGGEKAVSRDVESMLTETGLKVTRLSGADRYATAAAIADELNAVSGKSDKAFVVSGESFADALSAGYAAAITGSPILYTSAEKLTAATAEYIKANDIAEVIIVGGEKAVAPDTAEQTAELAQVTRISGADRYATSLAVAAAYSVSSGNELAAVATGENFPDALTGGALAVRLGTPVLLVGDEASEELLSFLDSRGTREVIIFGGENAVSSEVADSLR